MAGNPPENYTGRESEEPIVWGTNLTRKSAGDSDVHNPCGHWHKKRGVGEELSVNIYGLLAAATGPSGASIWGVRFDIVKLTLTSVALWHSVGEDVSGLVLYEGNLLTIVGDEATTDDRYVLIGSDPTPSIEDPYNPGSGIGLFPTIRSKDPFLQYDTWLRGDSALHPCLTYNAVGGEVYYTDRAGVVVKTIGMDTRVSRGYFGTVITGTDGHLYVNTSKTLLWNPATQPITGASWAGFWALIPDDINDGPLGEWGITNPVYSQASCLSTHHIVVGNDLYLAPYSSDLSAFLRRINKDTFEIYAASTAYAIRSFRVFGTVIYAVRSIATTTVYKFNSSTLVTEASQLITGATSVVGTDCEIVGDKLIVISHEGASGTDWVHKLNLDTLVVEASREVVGNLDFQRILKITERYIVIGSNSSMTLFDCDDMVERDTIIKPLDSGHLHTAMVKRENL